jgi:hypothetical protein
VQATTVRVKCPAGVSAGQPLRVRFDDREFDIIVRQQHPPCSIDIYIHWLWVPLPAHAAATRQRCVQRCRTPTCIIGSRQCLR